MKPRGGGVLSYFNSGDFSIGKFAELDIIWKLKIGYIYYIYTQQQIYRFGIEFGTWTYILLYFLPSCVVADTCWRYQRYKYADICTDIHGG
jgi:hypothetical protein